MFTSLLSTDEKYRQIFEIATATGIDMTTLETIYDGTAKSASVSTLLKLNDYFQSQLPQENSINLK